MSLLFRKSLIEAAGTYLLVFFGTGAVVVDSLTEGALGHIGISLAFGLAVMTLIHAFGESSGAHLNPAVTAALWLDGRFPLRGVLPYTLAQCLGALGASLTLKTLFPDAATLGETLPAKGVPAAFAFEVLLTFFLMLVILEVITGSKEKGLPAAIAIGGTVGLEALMGGPISGASMNPARSLGPALASGNLSHLWLYWAAPLMGACLAIAFHRFQRQFKTL